MKEHSVSSDTTTYEVYLIFREMADLARHIERQEICCINFIHINVHVQCAH